MRITEDVRKYAQRHQLSEDDALKAGLEQKAREFAEAASRFVRRHNLSSQASLMLFNLHALDVSVSFFTICSNELECVSRHGW
jgi:hypothetical protein